MKTSLIWGTIFGIPIAIYSLIMSIFFFSNNNGTLACVGLLFTLVLTVACGWIAAFKGKTFLIGFVAGLIATGIDIIASLLGYLINPAILQFSLIINIISFAISFIMGIVFSAAGAGAGYYFYKRSIQGNQVKAISQ